MEENIAILIADLSGYTALTETHGATAAANTIDKFLQIVEHSLYGESKFHQRVGDEVMIVAKNADDLINTAIALMQNCSKEKDFLQLHGGLHYGKVLIRDDHYYGSPVNTTSRIATKAGKGTFWCSSSFIGSLSNAAQFSFVSKGHQEFKNVSEQVEAFELVLEKVAFIYVDPVCRMLIHTKENAVSHPLKANIFFCSKECMNIYLNIEKIEQNN